MGNLRAVVTIASICFAAAACGDDGGAAIDAPKIIDAPIVIDAPPDAYVPDAPNYDFSCYQNTAPAVAANVQAGGTAREVILNGFTPMIQPSNMAQIDFCTGNCQGNNRLDRKSSDAQGAFTSAAVATNGTAIDGYLLATKAGNRTTYVYPSAPLSKSELGIPVFILSDNVVQGLGLAGINQLPVNSIVGILVTDCAATPVPIPAAVVSVTQNGAVVGDPPQDVGALDPQGEGAFIVFNVPANANTVVSATYNGMTFRSHAVGTVSGTTTMTQVKPGF